MLTICYLLLSFSIKAFLYSTGCGSGFTTLVDVLLIFSAVPFLYADIQKSKTISFALKPIVTGFIFRISLVFWDFYGRSIFILPNSGADSEGFYRKAVIYAKYGTPIKNDTFSNLMGAIFSIIGTSRLYGQFIIALFSIVSLIIFAHLLAKADISHDVRNVILWVVCLLPNYAILSSIFLRESVISMFITISFFYYVKWMKGSNSLSLLLAFIFAFTASAFHSGSAAVAIGYIAIILLYDRSSNTFRFKVKNLIPAIILLGVVAYLYINYSAELFGKMQKADSINEVGNTRADGGSTYAQYVGNSNNPVNMVIYTPLRIVFFLFSPFPWQWRGIGDIIAFVFSSMFFLYAAWCDIRFLMSGNKKNRTLVIALTIVAACTVFVFAWGVSNTGTACRHRDKIVIIWGLILALTWSSDYLDIKNKTE